ncbi:MAG TPA: alkaline phosphatase PhoX [Sporichthya sp.]|nr:alkaline phosphatase PhoX [Sporichthya sp.]
MTDTTLPALIEIDDGSWRDPLLDVGELLGPQGLPASRRAFLLGGAGIGLGLALTSPVPAAAATPARAEGLGGLVPDPRNRLSLPAGFSYRVVAEAGVTELSGAAKGVKTPGHQDGSASFRRPGGGYILVNNHEHKQDVTEHLVPPVPGYTYDPGCHGGTTNVHVDVKGHRIAEFVSLAGTEMNCAGGPTPWGTWLSCEETEGRRGEEGRTQDHGYVFEVHPRNLRANRDPKPITALGRFAHEAAAVDPRTGQIYLTEDAAEPLGLLYRFTPPRDFRGLGPGKLRKLGHEAGRLQAMRALDSRGRVVRDLSVAHRPGTVYRLEWVEVPDRDAAKTSTRKQFAYAGAKGKAITRSRKLEGAWWSRGGAFVVASFARPADDGSAAAHEGQVWFVDPQRSTLTLVLWFAPNRNHDRRGDGPDNITASPYGGVILAEDGVGAQHLISATADGQKTFLARNEVRDGAEYSEFTGPNFSYDRKFLFANVQVPGTVFAIRGPFGKLAR